MWQKLFRWYNAYVDWFIPPDLRDVEPFSERAELLRSSRYVINCCTLSAPLIYLMFFIRLAAEGSQASKTIYVLPTIATFIFALPLVSKKTKSPVFASIILMIVVLFVIPFRAYHTGGVSSPVIMWLATAVLWIGLIRNWKYGVATALFGTVGLGILAFGAELGLPPPPATPPPLAQVAVSGIGLLVVALIASTYEKQRIKYEHQLKEQALALAREKVHAESLNGLLSAMMDSVGQGFLIFNESGLIASSFSKACVALLDSVPAGRRVWDVLVKSGSTTESIMMWLRLLFHSDHDFENLRQLGPQTLTNSQGRTIRLEYYPVFQNQKLTSVVLVATDISEEVRAKEQAVRDRAQSSMILKMVRNNAAFVQFNLAIERFINSSLNHLNNLDAHSEELLRAMHTIKGTANTLSMLDMAEQAHRLEGLVLDCLKHSGAGRDAMIKKTREELEVLRQLHKQVIRDFSSVTGNQQSQQKHYRRVPEDLLRSFFARLESDSIPVLRQEFAKDFIFQPVGGYFNLIDDAAKDLAERLYKQVKPVIVKGGDYPVDLQPYLPLFETFVHAIRNAIDHGIELPSKRQDYGKDPAGQLSIAFEPYKEKTEKWLRIRIADDGGGIDSGKVLKRAQDLNIIEKAQTLTEEETIQLIFHAGFSTRSTVTDISGRGVGLDAIKNEAIRMGGRVYAKSTLTKGSEIVVEVPEVNPLTLPLKVSA